MNNPMIAKLELEQRFKDYLAQLTDEERAMFKTNSDLLWDFFQYELNK